MHITRDQAGGGATGWTSSRLSAKYVVQQPIEEVTEFLVPTRSI